MAISFNRYIDITSGIGAGTSVSGRDLGGRLFTTNDRLAPSILAEATSAADVAALFGSESEEYRRAAFYFGFVSKIQTKARKISFWRYAPEAVAASLRGSVAIAPLSNFKDILYGGLSVTLGATTLQAANIDLTGIESYGDIAALLQEALRQAAAAHYAEEESVPAFWSNLVVTYDSLISAMILTAGTKGALAIDAAADLEGGANLASLLRWTAASGALAANGVEATSVTDTLNQSSDVSNDFGSFLFLADLDEDQMVEAGNFAQLSNMGFLYCQGVTLANAAGLYNALAALDGTALTLTEESIKDEYPDMVPMILLASTDYTRRNSAQNYMFQQLDLTPLVTTNALANSMDALRVNYYGRTQQAGQQIDFYQRGVLLGEVEDMNIYANEMWLKDQCGVNIMNLLLALPQIAANNTGRAQVLAALRPAIEAALKNGVISVNKTLNNTQKTFITAITGDELAWVQVEGQGYWLDAVVEEYQNNDRTEYKITYLLIYAKSDAIRKVEGTHSLI